jgi:hypothetical protein
VAERTTSVFLVVALIVVVGVGTTSQSISPPVTSTGSSHATLADLVAGKFPTALDKRGLGGVSVSVEGLYVLKVEVENDGDWHVIVTDGKTRVFVTEITPQYQTTLKMPTVGSTIDETGIAYCDTFHENESWHGDTCWEIHPVTEWQISSQTLKINAVLFLEGIYAQISYAQNPIRVGSTQTITVKVLDSDGPAPDKVVYMHLVYASGTTSKDFVCATDASGTCSASWKIEGMATPGTFTMTASVDAVPFFSSLQVTA